MEDLGRRLLLAAIGCAVALAVAVLADGPLSEPLLKSLTYGLLVAAVLLSAAVAASWWFLVAGIPIVVLSIALANNLGAFFFAVVTAPAVFAILGAAVVIGQAARARRGLHRGLQYGMAGCIVLASGVVALDASRPPVDKRPENALAVDWRDGTYEGITLRSRATQVIARLGRPDRRGQAELGVPVGEDYYDIGGPTSSDIPGGAHDRYEELRYRRRAFSVVGGRVHGWVTTSPRAQTPEGVGVGDSRDLVKERYPAARCEIGNEGTEWATFPLCEVRACRGRLLAFGGDPIKSVWLIAETNQGWAGCRDPTRTASG